jgi:methionine sulfoxide reductase heme-binding subunit
MGGTWTGSVIMKHRGSARFGLNAWPLWFAVIAVIGAVTAAMLIMMPGYPGGIAALRFTARTSFVLFTLAFTASALAKLWPGAMSFWLLRNRRYLGLAFAGSHAIHLAVILTFWNAGLSSYVWSLPLIGFWINVVGYIVIGAMALTSFDLTRRALGPAAWSMLHLAGGYYIWFAFAKSYLPRAFADPFYWPFAGVLVAILVLRWRARTTRSAMVRP